MIDSEGFDITIYSSIIAVGINDQSNCAGSYEVVSCGRGEPQDQW